MSRSQRKSRGLRTSPRKRSVPIMRFSTLMAMTMLALLALVGTSLVMPGPFTSHVLRIMMVLLWGLILWFLGVSVALMVNRVAERLSERLRLLLQIRRLHQPRLWPPVPSRARRLQMDRETPPIHRTRLVSQRIRQGRALRLLLPPAPRQLYPFYLRPRVLPFPK